MSRKKQEPQFKTWEEVNQSLKRIGEIDRMVTEQEAEMNNTINMIKQSHTDKVTPLLEEKKILEKNVQAYTEYNSNQFEASKTKNLNFGDVGFKKTTSIVTRNVKAIIGALKQYKMLDCIDTKTTESINKEELKKYSDEAIEKVGAKRQVKDKYFYKISEERIES